MASVIKWFKSNKEDVLALLVISLIIVLVLSSYTFNALAPQEGWYSIYARNILQDGLIPYKDFFLVVPPVHLYIWTLSQAIFGDNFVVFHILNIFFQIGFAAAFYVLFRQIFSIKISVITVLFIALSRIFAEFDNGVISYNTLAFIFAAFIALFTIKQVNFINTNKNISKKWLFWLSALFALSFLNKQTTGALSIMASVLILCSATFKVLGFKQMLKHVTCLFLGSVCSSFILLLPLLFTGALPYMFNIIFNGASKGSPLLLFLKLFILPFPRNLWFWYILVILVSFILLPKSKNFKWENIKNANGLFKFLTVLCGIVLIIFLCVVNVNFANYASFYQWARIFERFLYVSHHFLYHISLFFSMLLFFYLIPGKNRLTQNRLRLFIIVMILLFVNVADLLSNTFLFPQFVGLVFGLLLLWKLPKFNKVKNIVIYCIICVVLGVNYFCKLHNPMTFCGWHSGSVLGQLERSYIPRMKGLKIPVQEKQMYEEIYDIVHHYTAEDDKILAFNNNQIFYDLTNRKPYTPYISLYHDVAPDNQPLEVLENMKNDLPKIIIFLRFSDAMEKFNEDLYRGHISGQRILRDYIGQLVEEGKYIELKSWKQYLFVDQDKMPKELLEKYINMRSFPPFEQEKIFKEIFKYSEMQNDFLQSGCTLSVLVREDLV